MFEYVILNIHSIKNNNNCRKRRFEGKGSAGDFEKSIAVFNDRLSKYRIQDTDQSVSCSFGFVCSRAETNGELIRLISQADKKLYEQKKQFILTK